MIVNASPNLAWSSSCHWRVIEGGAHDHDEVNAATEDELAQDQAGLDGFARADIVRD